MASISLKRKKIVKISRSEVLQTWDPEIAIAGKFRKHIDTEQESEVKKLNDRIEILEKALQTARDEAFSAGMEEGKGC